MFYDKLLDGYFQKLMNHICFWILFIGGVRMKQERKNAQQIVLDFSIYMAILHTDWVFLIMIIPFRAHMSLFPLIFIAILRDIGFLLCSDVILLRNLMQININDHLCQ